MPMERHPQLEQYLHFLRAADVQFTVAVDLVRDPDHDGTPHANLDPVRELRIGDLPPIREHRNAGATLSACHATLSVANAMVRSGLVRPGEPFWDVGCGTGVLAIVGARLGARPITATDVDTEALALARQNAGEAGVELVLSERSLLAGADDLPIRGLLAANLPHKPCAEAGVLPRSQDGGPDGDRLFAEMLDQANGRLEAGARLVFFLHSLPHPRLLARMGRDYQLTLLSWKRRFLDVGEYGPLQDWFVSRHDTGTSYVGRTEDGRRFLVCGIWLAGCR